MSAERSRRRLRATWGLVPAVVLGLWAGAAAAQDAAPAKPSAALPRGIPEYADTRKQCFVDGEKQAYAKWLDSQRISLPGCDKPVIPPQAVVESFAVYKRGSSSIVDCESLRRNDFNSGYLDQFLEDLVNVLDGDTNPTCAANMIHAWASAGAMTSLSREGTPNQAAADRNWTFAGISSGYLIHPATRTAAKAATLPGGGSQDDVILKWFGNVAGQISSDIDTARAARPENNLQYWRAFAVLPTALLTANGPMLQKSQGVFARGLQQATRGDSPVGAGFLPEELKRRDKSMNYQTFAAYPLVGMASLSRAYGCDFLNSDWKGVRLAAVVARSVEGMYDPSIFENAIATLQGKPVHQTTSGMNRQAGRLLFLMNDIDPALYRRIDAAAAKALSQPQPVLPAKTGANNSYDRLGGSFKALAATGDSLRSAPVPKGLAGTCPFPRPSN